MSDNPHMHGGGESYSAVVPAKHSNQGGQLPAEDVEGRALTKENMEQSNPVPNSRVGKAGQAGWTVCAERAKGEGKLRFTALLHHVTVDQLRSSYHQLKKGAALGWEHITFTGLYYWRRHFRSDPEALRSLRPFKLPLGKAKIA